MVLTFNISFSKGRASQPTSYRIANSFLIREPPKFPSTIHWNRLYPDTTCEVTETILSLRRGQTRMGDIKYLLGTTWSPRYFSIYLPKFLKLSMSGDSASDYQRFVRWTWKEVVSVLILEMELGPSYPMNVSESLAAWSSVIGCLIEQGADIHCLDDYARSAYLQILLEAKDPLEADEYTHAWLSLLESCGVPIGPYIEQETQIVSSGFYSLHPHRKWPRTLVAIDFEGIYVPSWKWKIDPGEETSELWEEFQGLIPERFPVNQRTYVPSSSKDYQAWLRNGVSDWERSEDFPFMPAALDYRTLEDVQSWREHPQYVETYKLALKVREGRFARREARKWRRAHPRERPPTQLMPGSWVD